MTAIFTESEYEIELSSVQGPAGTDGLGVTDIVAGDGIIIDAIQASQINIEIDETFVEENAQEMGLLSATQVQTFSDAEKLQARTNIGVVLLSEIGSNYPTTRNTAYWDVDTLKRSTVNFRFRRPGGVDSYFRPTDSIYTNGIYTR